MPSLPLSWSQWQQTDASALAELLRDRQVTAEEVALQAATAVEIVNPQLQASLEVFLDAVEEPIAAGANPGGPMFGVPMFMKDSGSGIAGRLREWGSLLTAGQRADQDCPLTTNLRRAGFNLLGRSALPEWGKTFDTTTSYLGRVVTTRNPWNLQRTPGGSSGGSAALVAAGAVPIAKAGDAVGSTRVPAAFTGLIGLKPSRGLLPPPTGTNELTNHRIQEGALTRTIRDQAAALDHMMRGGRGAHFVPAPLPATSYVAQITRPPKPVRVGVSTGAWGLPGVCHPSVVARVNAVARQLEELGHHVEEIDDNRICQWEPFWEDITTGWPATSLYWADVAQKRGWSRDRLKDTLEPQNANLLEAGEHLTLRDFKRSLNGNPRSTTDVAALMQAIDVLLCPTFGHPIPNANGAFSLLAAQPFDAWYANLLSGMRYTVLGNETGIPALAFPAELDEDGLPIGVTLYGRHLEDGLLLQVAAQVCESQPSWSGLVPPVSVGAIG